MQISVIIVSYNVKEFLYQCLVSLRKALEGIRSEIVVIDNNSVDGTPIVVEESFPDVKLIRNDKNYGFARACNQGLKITRGKYILFLNPDTIIQEDTIRTMLSFFEDHGDAGAAGCKILNSDGTLQLPCRRSFPSPFVAFTKLVGLSRLFPQSRLFGRYNLTYLDPDEVYPVDAVSGSFMMIRREVYEKIGGFDENFFMYGEDLDYCYRINKAGWRVYYVPLTKIIHYKGESAKLANFDNIITFYKAMDIFVRKYYGRGYSAITDVVLRTGIVIRGIISFLGKLLKKYSILIIDTVLIVSGILVAHRFQPTPLPPYRILFSLIAVYVMIWIGIGYVVGLYDKRELSYSRALVASFLSFTISAVINGVLKASLYSPKFLIWSFVLVSILLPGWRLFVLVLQRRRLISPSSFISRTLLSRRVIIVGAGNEGRRVAERLHKHLELGFEIIGFVDKEFIPGRINEFPFLGTVRDLPEIIRIHRATELIFTLDRFNNNDILTIMDSIKQMRIHARIVPQQLDYILGKSSVEKIEDIPLVDVDYSIYRPVNKILKRTFDIVVSFFLSGFTLFALPWLYLVGFRLERGRFVGVEGKIFSGFLLKRGKDGGGNTFIEKLPLSLSVLRGDMSIVGSELVKPNPSCVYLRCKPGLTGLGQLQKNSCVGKEANNFEYYYMLNYSLFLDIEIIVKALLKI